MLIILLIWYSRCIQLRWIKTALRYTSVIVEAGGTLLERSSTSYPMINRMAFLKAHCFLTRLVHSVRSNYRQMCHWEQKEDRWNVFTVPPPSAYERTWTMKWKTWWFLVDQHIVPCNLYDGFPFLCTEAELMSKRWRPVNPIIRHWILQKLARLKPL